MKKVVFAVIVILIAVSLFAQSYEVGDHDLFLMSTAKTIPKGTSYFSDYELFFINYTFGITDRASISAYSLFPIVEEFLQTLTLSYKQNYLRQGNVQSAFWLTYILDAEAYGIGNVVSVDTPGASIHFGLTALNTITSDDYGYMLMLGAKANVNKKTDFILEYENVDSGIENDFNGVLTLGLRFKGKTITWDIAGIRPLIDDNSSLLFLPFVKATVFFD